MSQLDRAKEALYGDTTVRDELADDEAEKLFAWAEARIADLVAKNLADDAFDAAWEELRKLLMRINRFVGRRINMSAEEQSDYLTRVADSASSALDVTLTPEQTAAFQEKQADLDNAAAVEALTQMILPPVEVAPSDTNEQATPNEQASPQTTPTEQAALPPPQPTPTGLPTPGDAAKTGDA
jgi:hypothetical protein